MGPDIRQIAPLRCDNSLETLYIDNLCNSYEISYDQELYDTAFFNAYLVFLSSLYVKFWQYCKLYEDRSRDFLALHRFEGNHSYEKIAQSLTPFYLGKMNQKIDERSFRRIFERMCFTAEDSKTLKELIDKRNLLAHANGETIFKEESDCHEAIQSMINLAHKLSSSIVSELKDIFRKEVGRFVRSKVLDWSMNPDIEERFIKNWYINEADIKEMVRFT